MLYHNCELCPHFSNFSDAQLCAAQGHLADCRRYTAASEQREAWLLGRCLLAAATSCESLWVADLVAGARVEFRKLLRGARVDGQPLQLRVEAFVDAAIALIEINRHAAARSRKSRELAGVAEFLGVTRPTEYVAFCDGVSDDQVVFAG
jgi:hypothetical protein